MGREETLVGRRPSLVLEVLDCVLSAIERERVEVRMVDELLRDGGAQQILGGSKHLLGWRHVREEGVPLALGNQSPDLVIRRIPYLY